MAPLDLRKIRFTERADKANSNNGIFNPTGSNVSTLEGDDKIIGNNSINSDFGFGVLARLGTRNAGAKAAVALSAEANVKANGIDNKGDIFTNQGRDQVRGTATAKVGAVARTVSQAIAYANKLDTSAVAATFSKVNVNAIANGIKNSGELDTGNGSDSVAGSINGSITAVATAQADAAAIVKGIAQAPVNKSLEAFAGAISKSIANASIIATGINNIGGKFTTGNGGDTINAKATSDSATLAEASAFTKSAATPGNQALAQAVAEAVAKTQDKAIAIDNSKGHINTGNGNDIINATANAVDKAVAINNTRGTIDTGNGADIIEANATGSESYGILGGTIRTGNGDDKIKASSFGGGVNIWMDNGNDRIEASSFSGGNIRTGNGNDRIEASSFGGGVNIWMGNGNDFVEGFGNAKVSGENGYDILSLGSYRIEDFDISLGTANKNQVFFEEDGVTMNTSNFEKFNFANGSFSYDDLVAKL